MSTKTLKHSASTSVSYLFPDFPAEPTTPTLMKGTSGRTRSTHRTTELAVVAAQETQRCPAGRTMAGGGERALP